MTLKCKKRQLFFIILEIYKTYFQLYWLIDTIRVIIYLNLTINYIFIDFSKCIFPLLKTQFLALQNAELVDFSKIYSKKLENIHVPLPSKNELYEREVLYHVAPLPVQIIDSNISQNLLFFIFFFLSVHVPFLLNGVLLKSRQCSELQWASRPSVTQWLHWNSLPYNQPCAPRWLKGFPVANGKWMAIVCVRQCMSVYVCVRVCCGRRRTRHHHHTVTKPSARLHNKMSPLRRSVSDDDVTLPKRRSTRWRSRGSRREMGLFSSAEAVNRIMRPFVVTKIHSGAVWLLRNPFFLLAGAFSL